MSPKENPAGEGEEILGSSLTATGKQSHIETLPASEKSSQGQRKEHRAGTQPEEEIK
jgi:hypothetical protein